MLVDIYHELGDARLALGRLDEAKKSLVKAEKIFDSVPADRHKVEKEIALARSMGQLCQAIDRPSLAVDFFRKVWMGGGGFFFSGNAFIVGLLLLPSLLDRQQSLRTSIWTTRAKT